MNRAEKAKRILKILGRLFPDPQIPLKSRDSFTLLVSTILSAQTTDKKVNQVTPELFRIASTPYQMAQMKQKEIERIIQSIGLFRNKAKALIAASRMIEAEFNGRVPNRMSELERLPGVGHKTASVVMAQAFGVSAFPVDTHIHRLAARWSLSDGSSVEKTERDLKSIFPEDKWNRLHLQMIYFGRKYCPARRHDLTLCPICSWAATKRRIREEMS